MGGPLLPSRIWKQRAPPRQMSPPDKVRKVLAVITSCVRSTVGHRPAHHGGRTGSPGRQEAAAAQKGGGVQPAKWEIRAPGSASASRSVFLSPFCKAPVVTDGHGSWTSCLTGIQPQRRDVVLAMGLLGSGGSSVACVTPPREQSPPPCCTRGLGVTDPS